MDWDPKVKILENSEVNLGHQENARIWGELENYLALTKEAGKTREGGLTLQQERSGYDCNLLLLQ
jgi:hypothetical protein